MRSARTATTFMARIAAVSSLALSLVVAAASADSSPPSYVAAALADPDRPAADKDRDAIRKPAEMVAFAGIKPGDAVLEVLPGGGYFTRIFSKVLGPEGHLFAAVADSKSTDVETAASAIASDVEYSNTMVISLTPEAIKPLPPLDVVWTSQNYHDLHLTRAHTDVAALDKAWFDVLKPGGVVVIVDHAALPGSSAAQTADSLHRIDPSVARREMEAAGFKFDGESDTLRNPSDPHTAIVFDPSIRGHTDQFMYRFRKPS
jgi:predicted methyltransferase